MITLIITTFNRDERLNLLLRSLKGVLLSGLSFPKHVIVVENGSSVSEETVKRYSNDFSIEYIHTPIGNKSAALNIVLEETDNEDLLVFFDDDIEIMDNTIFEKYLNACSVFGSNNYFGGEFIANYQVQPGQELVPFMPLSNRGYQSGAKHPHKGDLVHFLGFNWAVLSKHLKAIGGFNINYGPGAKSGARGQETDAQDRLRELGLSPVTVPGTTVAHYVPEKYNSEEWISERRVLSAMRNGQLKGSFLKAVYWWLLVKWYGRSSQTISSRMLASSYRGLLEGWSKKS